MLYADKKALDYSSVSAPIAEAQNNQELISITNITQYFESSKVLIRNSLITPEMDADYMDAVNNGDLRRRGYRAETIRYMLPDPDPDPSEVF